MSTLCIPIPALHLDSTLGAAYIGEFGPCNALLVYKYARRQYRRCNVRRPSHV